MTAAFFEVGLLAEAELVVDIGVALTDRVAELAVFRHLPVSQAKPGWQQAFPPQHVVPWGQQPKCKSAQSQSGGRKTQELCYACSSVAKGVMGNIRRTFATRNCSKVAARAVSDAKFTGRTAVSVMAACWR